MKKEKLCIELLILFDLTAWVHKAEMAWREKAVWCLNPRAHDWILSSLLSAVAFCLLVYWRITDSAYTDIREVSIFISHIRFSLLLSIGVCICLFVLLKEKYLQWFAVLCLLVFVYFMWVIESVTGFSVLLGVAVWWILNRVFSSAAVWLRIAFSTILVALLYSVGWYVYNCYTDYFKAENIDLNDHTINFMF